MEGRKFGRLLVLARAPNTPAYKTANWLCRCDCGKETIVNGQHLRQPKRGIDKSCGCAHREWISHLNKGNTGPRNSRYKAHRQIKTNQGYILVLDRLRNKWTGQHRIVMEESLGRSLHPDESVHHKNGIRDDNRPENLELRASAHGRGQTIPDLVAWAKEILARYGSSVA